MTSPEDVDANSTVPNAISSGVVVNGATIVLFDDADKSISVAAEDVSYWVARGFRKTKFDIDGTRTKLKVLLTTAADSVDAFVDEVLANGSIDAAIDAPTHAANVAFGLIYDSWHQLQTDIHRKYEVKSTTPPVSMSLADVGDGTSVVTVSVDPGQVEHYKSIGYTEAR